MNKIVEYMAMGRPIVSFDLREARVSARDAAVYATAERRARVRAPDRASCSTTPSGARAWARSGGGASRRSLSWDLSRRNLLEAYADALSRPYRRAERRRSRRRRGP